LRVTLYVWHPGTQGFCVYPFYFESLQSNLVELLWDIRSNISFSDFSGFSGKCKSPVSYSCAIG
jgi:hypothetical protein